ncbi:MAG: hypothetical protein ABL998_00880 [Planctomycetota bacterium]
MIRPDWGGWPLALGALALVAASCGALGWSLEPEPQPIAQATPAESAPAACRCLDQPPPPAPKVHTSTEGPQGAGAAATTIGTVAAVGGLLTGNPVAWALAGQLAHVLLGAVAGRRRSPRIPTGELAPR